LRDLLAFPHQASGAALLAGGSHPRECGAAWHNDLADLWLINSEQISALIRNFADHVHGNSRTRQTNR
jgi:hypothetical protein